MDGNPSILSGRSARGRYHQVFTLAYLPDRSRVERLRKEALLRLASAFGPRSLPVGNWHCDDCEKVATGCPLARCSERTSAKFRHCTHPPCADFAFWMAVKESDPRRAGEFRHPPRAVGPPGQPRSSVQNPSRGSLTDTGASTSAGEGNGQSVGSPRSTGRRRAGHLQGPLGLAVGAPLTHSATLLTSPTATPAAPGLAIERQLLSSLPLAAGPEANG